MPQLPPIGADVTSLIGNVNLYAQPKVKNPDGSISTVDSRSFNIDGQEVLLPSVTPDGRHLQTDAAILAEYKKTGRHLGKFPDVASANAAATQLHHDYAAGKYDTASGSLPPIGADVSHLVDSPNFAASSDPDSIIVGVGPFAHSVKLADLPPDIRAQLQDRSAKGDQLLQNVKNVAKGAVSALPAAGGLIGGALGSAAGPVGAMVGAAGGGAIGEGARTVATRVGQAMTTGDVTTPIPLGSAAGRMATQGAIQGAGEGVGQAAVAGATKAAPWLMNRALNLTDRLSREFPDLSSTTIEKAITVSQGGLAKARLLLGEAKADANAALTTAHRAGAKVPITAATQGLQRTLTEVLNGPDIEGGLATLASVERKITAGRAADLTPMEADALKTSLQTQSKALYLAQKMGQGRPNVTVKAQALADMAASLNTSIGDVTTAAGAPGYRAANADAAEMIGAVRGVTKGTRTGSNLYQAMVRPGVGAVIGGLSGGEAGGTRGAVAGALVGGALTSPAGMSRLAIALSRPGVQIILRGAPRLSAAVASLMAGQSGQEP